MPEGLPERSEVVIVGGGVLGASVQVALARRGVESLLLDRAPFGLESTGKSAAIVRMHYSHPDVIRMAVWSRDVFRTLADEAGKPVYQERGWLFLVPDELAASAREIASQVAAVGATAVPMSATEALELAPMLNPQGVGLVVHEPESGFADPVATTRALIAKAEQAGARALSGINVRSLVTENGAVSAVETDAGRVECEAVVLAAGPWSAKLAATAGVDIPLEITREQDLLVRAVDSEIPELSISNAVDAIYVRPLLHNGAVSGAIVGRGYPKSYQQVDPDDYDHGIDAAFEEDVRERASLRFGALGHAPKQAGRAGLYAVTPDWQPILGQVPGVGGLVLATGGSGHCFKLGPAIGEMVAAGMVGDEPADGLPDPRLFELRRFAEGRTFTSRYGGNRA